MIASTTTRGERPGRRRGPALRTGTALAAVGLLIAGCGGGSAATPATDEGGGGADEPVETPRIAFTTSYLPATYLNTRYGPIEYGSEYGFEFTEDHYTIFDGHATAMQALLSGEADIIGGSFISDAVLRQEGQDLEVFCQFNNADTLVLVGRNGITDAEQLFDAETRVATDSPGGAGSMVFNALLEHLDAPGLTDDLPNTTILESSGLRATAVASDQVDASVIQMQQYYDMENEVDDLEIMASFAHDIDNLVMQAYAARSDWLAENEQVATDFCATILKANEALAADFELFTSAAETYLDEMPTEDELRTTFDLVQTGKIWPAELTEEAVEYTLDLGHRSGVLDEPIAGDDLMNYEIAQAAIDRAAEAG